ncbi:MAG: isoprenylcysteine carboxylmethyltransferase family protein [Dehalococcoidales bacterium]|nr:isoprenylcysteine carboxylmethyltransferase family protein [Dehalococcoidales bacterium]
MTVLSVLGIVCFPANPLVLTGVLEVNSYTAMFVVGWVVWAIGMALVLSPIIMFPRRGGISKGDSFVKTTRLVNTGIYAMVRNPQYLGGILSIFVTTFLWYPHWLFAVLGVAGTVIVYQSIKDEERQLLERFGDEYSLYMQNVPRMNILAGVIRLLKRRGYSSGENRP